MTHKLTRLKFNSNSNRSQFHMSVMASESKVPMPRQATADLYTISGSNGDFFSACSAP